MRVLFASGGTGGHIFPIIAVKNELELIAKERNFAIEFLFVGHVDALGISILEQSNIPYKIVYAGKVRRYLDIANFTDIFKAIIGIIKAQYYIWKFMPDVTFGKGGYASVPGVVVSWLYQVPCMIHESDSVPGMANKFLARFAKVVAVAYGQAKKYFPNDKTTIVGNMTHPDITQGSRQEAKNIFSLTYEKPVLLITGGSQGAQIINEVIWGIIPELTQLVEVIHLVGMNNMEPVRRIVRSLEPYAERMYHPYGFLNTEMKHAYAGADLILSRSGASGLTDIAMNSKPSILIPLTIDSGQQKSNAYEFAKVGASEVIEEPNCTPHLLLSKIEELIQSPQVLTEMGSRASIFATPDAARRIAEELVALVK